MAAAQAGGGGARALSQREQDIQMMLAADVHLGTKNCDFQMERYVYKRRSDGISHFSLDQPNAYIECVLNWTSSYRSVGILLCACRYEAAIVVQLRNIDA
jgi:ribosomal protein S2